MFSDEIEIVCICLCAFVCDQRTIAQSQCQHNIRLACIAPLLFDSMYPKFVNYG